MKELREWGLTAQETLIVGEVLARVSEKIAAATKAKAKTAIIYKCPVGEVKLVADAATCIMEAPGDWATLLAAETDQVFTGTARFVALNCVQKGLAAKLVIQFIKHEPHIAIRL